MIEDVYNYFIDLENSNCKKDGNILLMNDEQFSIINEENNIIQATINNTPFYLKSDHSHKATIQSIAASKLLKHSGIVTPPIFITKEKSLSKDYPSYLTTTQDVTKLPLDCKIAGSVYGTNNNNLTYLDRPNNKFALEIGESDLEGNKWNFVIDQQIKDFFLQFMTPACFDQLVNMFLVDELRTEKDCHDLNYFFYKSPGSVKYEGVIRIDLDRTSYPTHYKANNHWFEIFLNKPYYSFTPLLYRDLKSPRKRIDQIRNILEQGYLTFNNIQTLKKALSFDYAKALEEANSKYKLNRNQHIILNDLEDTYKHLWEYHRNTLGKDLCL